MAPDTPVWQPAIFTRPERNMTISRLCVNYQCAELYPGLRTSPQCNVPAPTTPAGFETWADSPLRLASQRSNQLGQRVRPAGEKLAGRLDCHNSIQFTSARLLLSYCGASWKPDMSVARSRSAIPVIFISGSLRAFIKAA